MADAITIKALQDASLDAKSLEEVVNGDEAKQVTTRKGETYPSVKKAIKELFTNGGIAGRFKTLAELQSSSLTDGGYALVADDDVDKNGIYIKDNGSWVKSKYDLSATLIDKLSAIASIDYGKPLLNFKDVDNKTYAYFDNNGDLHLSGLGSSVQDSINSAGSSTDGSYPNLVEFRDSKNKMYAHFNNDGVLNVSDIISSNGNKLSDTQKDPSVYEDYLKGIAVRSGDTEKRLDAIKYASVDGVKHRSILADATDFEGYEGLFGPSITRIGTNKYFLAFDVRETGGDYDEIYLAGRVITYSKADKSFALGEYVTLARGGLTDASVKYTFLNPNVTYVENGIHKGRILVHFNYMTLPTNSALRVYKPYYIYSDDGGKIFTSPIDMSDIFDMSYLNGRLNFGPGHGIQLKNGKHKDRILLAAYCYNLSKELNAICVYSDDGGDTYKTSNNISSPPRLNEWQVAEYDGAVFGILRLASGVKERYRAASYDSGETFNENAELVKGLVGAGTKTGLVNLENPFDSSQRLIVATTAHNTPVGTPPNAYGRTNNTAFLSYDGGITFPISKRLDTGICQYTDAVSVEPDYVLCLHGGGEGTVFTGGQIVANLINIAYLYKD